MITVEDVIKPLKGSAINLKPIIEDLENRYSKHIALNIKYKIGIRKDIRYIAFKVPSEHDTERMSKITYDVLLEFIPKTAEHFESKSLRKCPIRLFSNCPSFTFTFTYIYKKLKSLAELQGMNKYSKMGLKKSPKKTNPIGISGIEKTIWFSIYKMGEDNLFDKKIFDSLAESSFSKFQSYVRKFLSQEDKLKEINSVKKIVKKKGDKKIKKKAVKSKKNNTLFSNNLKTEKKSSLKKKLKSEEKPRSLIGFLANKGSEFISNLKTTLHK